MVVIPAAFSEGVPGMVMYSLKSSFMAKVISEVSYGHSFELCWNIKQNGMANKSLTYRKHLFPANYVLVVDIKTKTLKI